MSELIDIDEQKTQHVSYAEIGGILNINVYIYILHDRNSLSSLYLQKQKTQVGLSMERIGT